MKREAVIVSAVRTPFGSFGGGLKELAATDLGAVVIREAVRRGGLTGREAEIDNVFMGQVVQAAAGQIPSRQATHKAGLPVSVPSETVNKVCASSLRAVNLGQQSVDAIEIGANIYDVKTDSPMGKIVSKEVLTATEQLTKADGTVVIAEKPGKFNVVVTIQVPGIETKYGYRANGRLDLNRESQQVLDTQKIILETKIVDVKNISKK